MKRCSALAELLPVKWAGEELVVLPQRALLWPEEKTLLITDPHFGKAATFRSAGIPIPVGTTADDLQRLDDVLFIAGDAERLIILGDFFHHKTGRSEQTMAMLGEWCARHRGLEMLLVRGNHDTHAGDPPADWGIRVVDGPLREGPFLFCHEPCAHPGGFVLGGHIHPGVSLRDPSGSTLRLPCFLFGETVGMLPAFGSFTGLATVRTYPGDLVFALTDHEVFQIPVLPLKPRPRKFTNSRRSGAQG